MFVFRRKQQEERVRRDPLLNDISPGALDPYGNPYTAKGEGIYKGQAGTYSRQNSNREYAGIGETQYSRSPQSANKQLAPPTGTLPMNSRAMDPDMCYRTHMRSQSEHIYESPALLTGRPEFDVPVYFELDPSTDAHGHVTLGANNKRNTVKAPAVGERV